MKVVGIDLAARYSGIILLQDDTVINYATIDAGAEAEGFLPVVDTLVKSVIQFLEDNDADTLDVICIEDLSHRMVKAANTLRIQGALRYELHNRFPSVKVILCLPSVWQRWFGYKKTVGTTTKGWSSYTAKALGYTFDGVKGKAATDLNDAVLIARWAYETNKDKY